MFKKSLLALSVAALSSTAMAGQIFSSVTVTDPGLTATELGAAVTFGSLAAAGTTDAEGDDCVAIATKMGVTATGVAAADAAGTLDDVATLTPAVGIYAGDKVASVVGLAGGETCNVTYAAVASSATDKSPIEQTGAITVGGTLVAGAGGYRIEDTLTINFSGAKIKTTTIPTLTTSASTAVFELLDITATTVRFTVKTGSADVPGNAIINLAGVVLDTAGLTSGSKVSIDTFATNTSGTKYDVTAAKAIHELVPQYSAKVTRAFDGIINVSDDRQSLLAEVGTATDTKNGVDQDTLIVDVTKTATTNEVAASDITFKVTGDFSWLPEAANASDDGKAATAGEITTYLNAKDIFSRTGGTDGSYADASSYALSADNTTLTIVDTTPTDAATGAATYGIRLAVPGKGTDNPVLLTQNFTVAAELTNGLTGSAKVAMTATDATAAGAWTLNGSVVTIPYMPFDDNTAVILRHTNTGVQTGDLSIRYMVEGSNGNTASTKWSDSFVVGESSRGVQNIRDIVINKIKEELDMDGGKVAIEITTNVPDADVTVYAAYRVKDENDRGFVGTFGKHGSAQ